MPSLLHGHPGGQQHVLLHRTGLCQWHSAPSQGLREGAISFYSVLPVHLWLGPSSPFNFTSSVRELRGPLRAVGGTQRTIKWSLPLIATKNTWTAVRGILADQKKRTQEIAEVPHTNTLVIFGRTRVSTEYSVPQSVTKV